MLWRRIPQINSEVECSRLAFAFWKRGEWMQALSGGIRWDLDVGEKNRSLDVVFEILPWAPATPSHCHLLAQAENMEHVLVGV